MNTVNVSGQQFSGALTRLAWLGSPWSPIAWAARGLIGIGRSEWLPGLGWTVLFIGLTSVIFYASLVTAERLYINGWARVQVGTRRKKRSTVSTTRPSAAAVVKPGNTGLLTRRIPAPIRAVMMKDYRVLSRDLRNLSQIVSPILIGVLYAVMLGRGGHMSRETEIPVQFYTTIQSVIIYANVGISLFVSWGLLSRLSLMSFSQEGSHYWLLKTAPIGPRQLLLSKYMVAYLPSLALGWVFMLAIFILQGGTLSVLFYGMAMIAFSTAGAVGISLSFGIAGANLKWENPRAMIRGTAGCVSSLVSFLYLGGIVAIFFGPTVIINLLGLPGIYGILAGLVVGIPVSLACAYFPPRAVMSRITRIGEE
jgi:ABC-2 type transport system permease protein